MWLADPSRKAATKQTMSSVFFAQMFAKKSEPPNFDVGGSDSRNAEAKKTASIG